MRPDPEMMLACDCQSSLGIGLEVAQGTFAVVGSRQKALAARCRFQLIVRRRLLEFRKWIFRGHRNSRAPAHPAPILKSLTPLDGNRKHAGALRQQCPLWVISRHALHHPMSALPLKADMRGATRDVRSGPEADIETHGSGQSGDALNAHQTSGAASISYAFESLVRCAVIERLPSLNRGKLQQNYPSRFPISLVNFVSSAPHQIFGSHHFQGRLRA